MADRSRPGPANGPETDATVLVVDDDAPVRESFADSLQRAGYAVRTADSGEATLRRVDEDVDVVLLDRRLSDASGDDVLYQIRDRNLDCSVAIVAAVDPDFDIVELDCEDYLVKPVTEDELLDAVERLALLNEYDEAKRELDSLRIKRNVLEVEKHPRALEDSDEFRRLEARIEELEDELDDLTTAFDERLGYER